MSKQVVTNYDPNAMSEDAEFALKESREYLQVLMAHIIEVKDDVKALKDIIKILRATSDTDRAALVAIAQKLDADIADDGASETDYEATITSALNS